MQFAVSNIAWAVSDRHGAYARLKAAEITGLEIAPGLFFSGCADPFDPTEAELRAAVAEVRTYALDLVSMQSILFGVSGADLFGSSEGRAAFTRGLTRAIILAERLGVPHLVLGSPKQRIRPEGMTPQSAMDRAAEALWPLAQVAEAASVKIGIECNPIEYGTNFLTTPDDTLAFVRYAAHPAITLNFDVGASHLTGTFCNVEGLLRSAGDVISHVHISEPHLAPAPADPGGAGRVLTTLHAIGYNRAISIEMRQPDDGLSGLDTALSNLAVARGILKTSAKARS